MTLPLTGMAVEQNGNNIFINDWMLTYVSSFVLAIVSLPMSNPNTDNENHQISISISLKIPMEERFILCLLDVPDA